MEEQIYIRKRHVCLTRDGRQTQAVEASKALRGIKGVHDAQPISHYQICLTYSLHHLSFEIIEGVLKELGFFLDDSIPSSIRRNIYQYLEDNIREKLHVDEAKQALEFDLEAELPHAKPEEYWNNYR